MLEIINFIGASIVFNLLFFLYAAYNMKNKLNPVQTTIFSIIFNLPLAIILASVYSITLIYAATLGANEEWVWEYMEHSNAKD